MWRPGNLEARRSGGQIRRPGNDLAAHRYNTGSPTARNTQGHDTAEEELTEEDEEEEHEVEAGVVAESLVGRPEPAEEGQGDEEEAIDEPEAEHGALVEPGEQEADAAEHVHHHQEGVD